MDNLKKILTVLSKNLLATCGAVVGLVLFFYFLGDLIPGLISTFGAVLTYVAGTYLYAGFKHEFAAKPAAKPAGKTTTARPVKETAKKTTAKKKSSKK